MRLSQLFTKTRKDAPADEVSKNGQLLIKAGYVNKEMAGVYSFLPLGLLVLENINQIIREEMNAIGASEVRMTTLQDPVIWQKTGRWSDEVVDCWFKTELKNNTQLGLGATHEEPITRIAKHFVSSYKDLPFMAYQIQTKFRNELRARSGVLRGREFLMKDLYSFSSDEDEHQILYEKIKQAYVKVFDRLGLGDITYLTKASGGMFSQFSDEFQTISEAGEDIIYVDEKQKIAVNEEVYTDEILEQLNLKKSDLVEKRAVEVGNIFSLGEKYSSSLGLSFTNQTGELKNVIMGCYGIGPSRLVGVITEVMSDSQGLVWPDNVAPYKVIIISIGNDQTVTKMADEAYKILQEKKISVLYDDRDERAGVKFADSDLIGIPHRLVISNKTTGLDQLEYKNRRSGQVSTISLHKLIKDLY